MAKNMVLKYTKTEVWPVATGTAPGTAVKSITDQPGVTITGSGDYTKGRTLGPYQISGIPAGGVGLGPLEATVAIDGAFRFPVANASASTPKNTLVYLTGAGALTLTAGTNTPFGKIDRHIGETGATECSVVIGRFIDSIGAS